MNILLIHITAMLLQDGETSLHNAAVGESHTDVVQLLIDKGAGNTKDKVRCDGILLSHCITVYNNQCSMLSNKSLYDDCS